MHLPEARGPLSAALLSHLGKPEHDAAHLVDSAARAAAGAEDPLLDDDVQLSLTLLYELGYRGLDGVDPRWEWAPCLLAARRALEDPFEAALRTRFGTPAVRALNASAVSRTLFDLAEEAPGPSLAGFVARRADLEQVAELCVLRSVYQLKEADPHSWLLPRLHGAAKSALVEIQADEYGGGRPGAMHSELFARTMRALGLDDTYGAYVDHAPAVTLAAANAMHLLCLHRRWRGAAVGHLAAYEITSSEPCRLYARGLRRLGLPDEAVLFFDEHVEADAVHEQLAAHDLAGGLVTAEPQLAADVLFGAAVSLGLDALVAEHVLTAWEQGRSALRLPVDVSGPVDVSRVAGPAPAGAGR
jgi:hypothetical protein